MTIPPETNSQLLIRLRDPQDREAWTEFVAIYQPLIYRVARRTGLQDADALNLSQDVLQKVSRKAIEKNVPSGGGFRKWLTVVAKNAAVDAFRKHRPDIAHGGSDVQSQLGKLADPSDSGTLLKIELKRSAFRWAAARIKNEFKAETWNAFWMTMVEGQSCEHAAAKLKKSVGAIYTSRSRVMQRLKKEVEAFDWEQFENESQHQPDDSEELQ